MGQKPKSSNEDKRFNVKWTKQWDTVLVDALVHQQSMGNRVDKVFITAAYNNVVKELHDKLGESFQKDHLKNRMKTLKHHFKECHYLFSGISDFTSCLETKLWTAEPEAWKDLIQARLDARKWMLTPVPNYDKLLLLFANKTGDTFVMAKDEGNPGINWRNGSDLNCAYQVTSQNDVTLTLEDLNGTNDGNDLLPTSAEANS